MFLYQVDVQHDHDEWDKVSSALVMANGSAQAKRDLVSRRLHPAVDALWQAKPEWANGWGDSWDAPYTLHAIKLIEVEQIGRPDSDAHGVLHVEVKSG